MRAFLANLIANQPDPLPLDMISKFCPSEVQVEWYRPFLQGRSHLDVPEEEIIRLRPVVHRSIIAKNNKNIPLKTHTSFGMIDGQPLIEAELALAVIYIVRDPRDVVVSGAHHFDHGFDDQIGYMMDQHRRLAQSEGQVPEFVSDWANHVSSWTQLYPGRKIIVRYEDLKANPVEEFGKIARTLGITQNKALIERAVAHSGFKTMKNLEEKGGFTEKPAQISTFFRAGSSGDWQKLLNRRQIKTIERFAKTQMQQFNYPRA